MLDFDGIVIENFRSFAGVHKFDFPKEPGLYQMTGVNERAPRLGANGVGKTSFIDAICWVLFGRTTRYLRGADVVTWGARKCAVTLRMRVGSKTLTVKRTHGPISLTVTDKAGARQVEQHELDGLIRLSQKAFLLSVILPQFGDSFFDLGATDKLNLFSDVANLEHWVALSKKADTAALSLAGDIGSLDIEIERADERLNVLAADITDLTQRSRGFGREQDERIGSARAALSLADQQLERSKENLEAVTTALVELDGKIAEYAAGLGEAEEDLAQATTARTAVVDKIAGLDSDLKELVQYMDDVRALKAICPTCHQQVDARHVRSLLAKADRDIEKIEKGIAALSPQAETLAGELRQIAADRQTLKVALEGFQRSRSNLTIEKGRLESDVNGYSGTVRDHEENIKAIRREANPYTQMIGTKRAEIGELEDLLVEARAELARLNRKHDAVTYWVGGFKRVRLFVIERALKTLEVEINNHLTELGLVDWSVELDVERENQKGGVTKGLVVLIKGPGNEKPVKWEAFSGGEVQRLRLAGDFALSNLILEQAGLNSKIEFHDEPSEHLSREGLNDLVEALYERAMNTGKQIWLVDHSVIDYGEFAGKLLVIKDKAGSHLRYDEGLK